MHNVIIMIGAVVALIFVWRSRSQLVSGSVVPDSLTGNEKLYVWLLCLLSPVLAGAIFYYGWKKVAPQKAKSANRISIVALLILATVFYGMIYLFKFNPLSLPIIGETSSSMSGEQAQRYEDPDFGFSIVPPAGWQKISDNSNPNLLVGYEFQDAAIGAVATINIVGDQIGPGITPDDYFANFQKLFKDAKLSVAEKIGVTPPTYRLTASYTVSGQAVIEKYLIKISGDKAFVVQTSSTEAGWQKYGTVIESSLATFNVK